MCTGQNELGVSYLSTNGESGGGEKAPKFGLNPASDVVWEVGQMRRNQSVLEGGMWKNVFHCGLVGPSELSQTLVLSVVVDKHGLCNGNVASVTLTF